MKQRNSYLFVSLSAIVILMNIDGGTAQVTTEELYNTLVLPEGIVMIPKRESISNLGPSRLPEDVVIILREKPTNSFDPAHLDEGIMKFLKRKPTDTFDPSQLPQGSVMVPRHQMQKFLYSHHRPQAIPQGTNVDTSILDVEKFVSFLRYGLDGEIEDGGKALENLGTTIQEGFNQGVQNAKKGVNQIGGFMENRRQILWADTAVATQDLNNFLVNTLPQGIHNFESTMNVWAEEQRVTLNNAVDNIKMNIDHTVQRAIKEMGNVKECEQQINENLITIPQRYYDGIGKCLGESSHTFHVLRSIKLMFQDLKGVGRALRKLSLSCPHAGDFETIDWKRRVDIVLCFFCTGMEISSNILDISLKALTIVRDIETIYEDLPRMVQGIPCIIDWQAELLTKMGNAGYKFYNCIQSKSH